MGWEARYAAFEEKETGQQTGKRRECFGICEWILTGRGIGFEQDLRRGNSAAGWVSRSPCADEETRKRRAIFRNSWKGRPLDGITISGREISGMVLRHHELPNANRLARVRNGVVPRLPLPCSCGRIKTKKFNENNGTFWRPMAIDRYGSQYLQSLDLLRGLWPLRPRNRALGLARGVRHGQTGFATSCNGCGTLGRVSQVRVLMMGGDWKRGARMQSIAAVPALLYLVSSVLRIETLQTVCAPRCNSCGTPGHRYIECGFSRWAATGTS